MTLLDWYEHNRRDLPWRRPGVSAWGIYVSEIMAQQTQVDRVASAWTQWLKRWPTPAKLAAASAAEVLRAWDRLGYPRRALWMHAAAKQMVAHHDGRVPRDVQALRTLPGVGEYTAAAIMAFAFHRRAAVLDVNVRRVHARLFLGNQFATSSITNAEREHHEAFLPQHDETAARLSQAVMEFGAVVCTAKQPACDACPVRDECAWAKSGFPTSDLRRRRTPAFDGTDRQCRGVLMRLLREAEGFITHSAVEAAWADAMQRQRCIEGLIADGLIVRLARDRYALPGDQVAN